MSRIQQAVQKLEGSAATPVKLIEQYISTGDRNLLSSFKLSKPTSPYWEGHALGPAVGQVSDWTDEDRRLVHVIFVRKLLEFLSDWLDNSLRDEKPDEDVFSALRVELESCGASAEDLGVLLARTQFFDRDGIPTSAGRYVLGLSEPSLAHLAQQTMHGFINTALIRFVLDFAADRMPALLPKLLIDRGHTRNNHDVASMTLLKFGKKVEKEIHAYFQSMTDPWHRFELAKAFFDHDAARYRGEVLLAARASLADPAGQNNHVSLAEWMIEKFGKEVLPDFTAYVAAPSEDRYWKPKIVTLMSDAFKQESLPALQAALKSDDIDLALCALPLLIALRDDSQDELILATLSRGFKDPTKAVQFIAVATRWKVALVLEPLWSSLTHKSKPVRDAGARALAQSGEFVVPRAGKLLNEKKADTRLAAVTLLATVNSPESSKLLEDCLNNEPDDNVRDAILLALEKAWAASGRKLTKKDVEALIARVVEKLTEPPTKWIDEARLPAVNFADGKPLGRDAVRYLLYRQSRAKEMRPDVEAKALYNLIDRSTSGDFAVEILKQFLASKLDVGDRWALTVAGLLGDDRVVPVLNQQIRQWAESSRGKMAEYAVEALSLLGTDAALLTIDSLATRYRAKNKNVGRAAVDAFAAAAENLGITPDELGDRVVPWFGFEPGKPRIIDCGGKKVEARIGMDLKLKFIDLEKNKPVASLPKTASKEVQAEFKELGATLREVVKAQMLRLENLTVRQQRWSVDRWRELFTMHPVLLPIATRLIWGVYNESGNIIGAFRPLEDRSFTLAADERFELPARGSVGIVHPLELSEEERKAWQTHLADYEISPPFPQLERPVVRITPDRADEKKLSAYDGISINGITFKGRADRLGWTRGSVCDGGSITSYVKGFPAAGVDVFLGLDGMYIGIDISSEIKLQNAYFVRGGSVQTGSYTYDEPGDERDHRVLRFRDVPPIVYSEVLGDLRKIAGKQEAADDDVE